MADGKVPLSTLVIAGAATAVGSVIIAGQVASWKKYRRRNRLRKAWKTASEEHRKAALKTAYPGVDIRTMDIAVFDEKAAQYLYGVVAGLEVELPRRGLK